MRYSLMDTQTTIALMRSDLAQLRNQYEDKCGELSQERERVMDALHEQEHLSRQLHILQYVHIVSTGVYLQYNFGVFNIN